MAELLATLTAKRKLGHEDRKFMAALQGVDIDDPQSDSREADPVAAVMARAQARAQGKDVSEITMLDPNDIASLQGAAGANAGFQIGVDMDYEVL